MADEAKCPYHTDHENRIKRLEVNVDKLRENARDPKIILALFSFLSTVFSTVGAVCGTLLGAYLKGKGYM